MICNPWLQRFEVNAYGKRIKELKFIIGTPGKDFRVTIDVLDELSEIKICIGYTIKDTPYDYLPFNEDLQKNIKPI